MKNHPSRKRHSDSSWDKKEDTKRKKWKDQEVMAMLNLINKHRLLEHLPTDTQLGDTLLKPMTDLGYLRTSHQIKLKIKNLRKSYIQYKKGNFEALRNALFFELLDSLYSHTDTKDIDSENESCEMDEDTWSESDVNQLILVIKLLDLSHELSFGSVSMKNLRQIHKSLLNFNVNKNMEQIKCLIVSLRNTYAGYQKDIANGSAAEDMPYFHQLNALWKREFASGNFYSSDSYEDFWSEEETVLLLEALKELNVTEINSINSSFVAAQVELFLSESSYSRTKYQILKRIENLKQNYNVAKQCKNLDEAIAKFPFYHRFERVFKISEQTEESFVQPEEKEEEKIDFENLIVVGKKKHNRGYIWLDEEVTVLLDLVEKMNLVPIFRGRMTLDFVSQLVKPLALLGYERTAWQIKIKLKGLRNLYYRCIQQNMSESTLAECPYFDKIHQMLQAINEETRDKVVSPLKQSSKIQRYKKRDSIIKNIEVDEYDQHFAVEVDETESGKNEESIFLEPLETIPDEEEEESIEHEIITNEEELSDQFEEVSESEEKNEEYHEFQINQSQIIEISNDNTSQIEYQNFENVHLTEVVEQTEDTELKFENVAEEILDSQQELENDGENILNRVLKHEETLQKQHQEWLEKQFAMQRKYESEQREQLLHELRELREAITSGVLEIQKKGKYINETNVT